MKDAVLLSILASSSISLPPNPSPSPHDHTTKPKSKPKPNHRPKSRPKPTKLTSHPPLLYSSITSLNRNKDTAGLKYHADMASKLAEDGRFEDFLMIGETIVASGNKASQFTQLMNLKLVSIGIVRLLKEGRIESLLQVLNALHKLKFCVVELFDGVAIEALRGECRRLMQCGEVEQVVSLMETLQVLSFPLKELVKHSEIIKLCVNKRNPSAAIRYAQIFSHAQILSCTIMLEFGKKGDLVSALTVFESSKRNLGNPNMFAYRTMIDVCGLCGDYLKSRSIYKDLLASKFTPNSHVFNSLMNVNASDLRYTMHVYKQMQELGVGADMATYNILLKSCCVASRVDLARGIYKEVQRLERAGALKLDVFTYSTIIKVFADAKLWKMALKVKDDMIDAGVNPNTVTWTSLISACANAGLIEQAILLFDEMIESGCEPNSQCCNILLHACVESCQYDRAFRLFKSWKESGFRKGSNVNMAHTREDCRTSARYQISDLHSSHVPLKVPFIPTTSTYNTLMKACGTDYRHAKALMDEMKTEGLSPNHISWTILINICGSSGNVENALQILRSMREDGIQPDVIAYTTAIKVCVECKRVRCAFMLFEEMKRYQIKPNMVTYNTLLRARSKYGSLQEVQQCLAIYQDMRKAGYHPNDYYLKRLIEEWCEEVIQSRAKSRDDSIGKITSLKDQSLLLDKVAEHLHKSDADSISIDLQGLSKVEARIVVLAVLRKIKEKYTPGYKLRDDLVIYFGADNSTDVDEIEVKSGVIRLLQYDMGLEILTQESANTKINSSDNNSSFELIVPENTSFLLQLESPTWRPLNLNSLKVSKNSLHRWLQKNVN